MSFVFIINTINYSDVIIEISNDLITDIYPLSTLLLPVFFSIVNFIYKERKDISYNTIGQKNSKITRLFIVAVIINSAIYLFLYIKGVIHNQSIEITNISVGILIVITFIIFIYLSIHSYFKMLNSINIFKLCELYFKKNNRNIRNLEKYLKKSNKFNIRSKHSKINKLLNRYNNSSQIIGQTLMAQIEYNLTIDFSKTLREYLQQQEDFFKLVNFLYPEEIINIQIFEEKSVVYQDNLDINYMLLEKVTKSNKREETEMLLYQYLKLIPGLFEPTQDDYINQNEYVEKMHEIDQDIEYYYYKILIYSYETMSKRNYFEMNDIFSELLNKSNQSQVYLQTSNIFTLYYVLIIQSIYNNDLKMLTNFVNLTFVLVMNQEENIIPNESEENEEKYKFTYYESLSKILIIAMLKSIELGHDKCTGFLIKVSVNHQKSLKLKTTSLSFKEYLDEKKNPSFPENGIEINSEDINTALLKEMNFKVSLSSRSFDYCYFKYIHLISKQQEYFIYLKLLDKNCDQIFVLNSYEHNKELFFNQEYMNNKLINMHKEYGMIALKSLSEKDKLKNKIAQYFV